MSRKPSVRLSPEQRREIWEKTKVHVKTSRKALAKEYNASKSLIKNIIEEEETREFDKQGHK